MSTDVSMFSAIALVVAALAGIATGVLWARLRRERRMFVETTEALQASEHLHRTLASHFPSGAMALFDSNLCFLIATGSSVHALGLLSDDLRGRTIWEAFPRRFASQLEPHFRAALAGKEESFEVRFGKRYYEVSVGPIRDEHGTIVAGMATPQDITERRQVREALSQAEARLRALIEQMPAVTYIQSVSNINATTYTSPQILKMIGYTPEEMTSEPERWLSLIHPDDRDAVAAETERCNQTGEPFRMEYRYVARDGSIVWVHDESTIVTDDDGNPAFWQGMMFNITQRKQIEANLDFQSAILHAQGEASPDAIVVRAPSGELVNYNQRFLAMWGLSAETMASPSATRQSALELVDDPDQFVLEIESIYGDPRETHDEILLRDGRVLERYGAPIRIDGDVSSGYVWFYRDITSAKQVQEELRRQTLYAALLKDVTVRTDRTMKIEQVLRNAVDLVCERLGWPIGHVYVTDGVPGRLSPSPIWHMSDARYFAGFIQATDETTFTIGVGLPGRVMATRRPEWISDVSIDPRFLRKQQAAETDIHTAFALPVIVQHEVVAVLECFTTEVLPIDHELLSVMTEIGNRLGLVIERHLADEALIESQQRFTHAFDRAPIGIALVSTDGHWMKVNDALCAMFGYSQQDLLATTFQDLTHPDDLDADLDLVSSVLNGELEDYTLEKRYFHRDGHIVWGLLSVSLVRDSAGAPLYFVSQIQDISERKADEQRLIHQALHDPLTGLPNRALLMERLDHAVKRARRGDHPSLLFIDLDGFKSINDAFGHEVGDQVLITVARRLQATARSSDTPARLAGDEFVVLLEDIKHPDIVNSIVTRLLDEIRKPILINEHDVSVSASIGIRAIRNDDRSPDDILRDADIAMYRVKRAGKGRFLAFSERG